MPQTKLANLVDPEVMALVPADSMLREFIGA